MKITIIAAHEHSYGIGLDGKLPWLDSSRDLKLFREVTRGAHLIMGRKTYESLPDSMQPNGRTFHVITSGSRGKLKVKPNLQDATVIHKSKENVMDYLRIRNVKNCYVIGGGQIYSLFMDVATDAILTRFNINATSDTYYPIKSHMQRFGFVSSFLLDSRIPAYVDLYKVKQEHKNA